MINKIYLIVLIRKILFKFNFFNLNLNSLTFLQETFLIGKSQPESVF